MPQEWGVAIRTQDVLTLSVTIATAMRMWAGRDLRFEVTFDETEGVSLWAMTLLRKQLLALGAEYKSRFKDEEGRDEKSHYETSEE